MKFHKEFPHLPSPSTISLSNCIKLYDYEVSKFNWTNKIVPDYPLSSLPSPPLPSFIAQCNDQLYTFSQEND
jgi:hypothetical protein